MALVSHWISAPTMTVVESAIPSRPPSWAFSVAPTRQKRGPGFVASHSPVIAPVQLSRPK